MNTSVPPPVPTPQRRRSALSVDPWALVLTLILLFVVVIVVWNKHQQETAPPPEVVAGVEVAPDYVPPAAPGAVSPADPATTAPPANPPASSSPRPANPPASSSPRPANPGKGPSGTSQAPAPAAPSQPRPRPVPAQPAPAAALPSYPAGTTPAYVPPSKNTLTLTSCKAARDGSLSVSVAHTISGGRFETGGAKQWNGEAYTKTSSVTIPAVTMEAFGSYDFMPSSITVAGPGGVGGGYIAPPAPVSVGINCS